MTRKIAIISGKGGVGKTTTAVNLGIALAQFGKDVTVVDANFTTPDLSLHIGSPIGTPTLHHVMSGEFTLEQALHIHPSGLKIVPASISIPDMKKTKITRLEKVIDHLGGDYVIMDTQAGLSQEVLAVIEASNDVLVVANPEWPSITDALKAILIAREHGANVMGVVLTRVRNEKHEPHVKGIEAILESEILGVIPEDAAVRRAIATKNPVVVSEPESDSAVAYFVLAARLAGVHYAPPRGPAHRLKRLLKKLFG